MREKQYKHLENLCNIQQRFINGEIKMKEFFKKLDDENQRYLLQLKEENQKIKQRIITQNNYQTKVYKIFDTGESR